MGLPLEPTSLEGIPEEYHKLYVSQDAGGYKMDVDGLPDVTGLKSTVHALREYEKKAKELETKYAGIDPEEVERLRKEAAAAKQEAALKGKSEEERLAVLTENMRSTYEGKLTGATEQIGKLTKDVETSKKDLRNFRIHQDLDDASRATKVKPEHYDDVRKREDEFDVVDGVTVAMLGGEPRRSAKDATKFMDPKEWLELISPTKPE